MTRMCRIAVVAAGLLAGRLLAAGRHLWWLRMAAAVLVVPAGLLAAAPAASAGGWPVAGVTVAQVGNDLLMAGQGYDDTVAVYYQTVGSSTWSQVTAIAPRSELGPVAITGLTYRVGLRRITWIGMAAEGIDGSLDFWWQNLADIGSGPWNQEVLSGPNTIFSAPSIVQIGNEVAISAQGAGNSLGFWWQQIGATGWNSYPGQAQGLVNSAPAMAVLASPSDTLGITFTDTQQGTVWYVQQTPANFGSWQGPYTVGSTNFPASYYHETPSIAALNNNLTAITTICANYSLCQWMTPDPPSFVNTTDGAFPGTVYNGVSTAQLGGGVVAATTQSANGTLEFYWRLPDSYWHLENLGGTGAFNLESPPQVIPLTNSAGTQLAATAVETSDFGADLYWQTIGASTWNLVTLPPGSFGA